MAALNRGKSVAVLLRFRLYNALLTSTGNTSSTMIKPYVLNQYERAALLALSQYEQVSAQGEGNTGFGRTHLEALLGRGLAVVVPSKTGRRLNNFRITNNGWLCMYGLTQAQIESRIHLRPAPFRVWQWPPPAALEKAA
ncbi:MAG TPA: hypothetical protein VL147_16115 [Devosia sp.]|nr:hypothetical protein [Devosia sp.]